MEMVVECIDFNNVSEDAKYLTEEAKLGSPLR